LNPRHLSVNTLSSCARQARQNGKELYSSPMGGMAVHEYENEEMSEK